MPRIIGQNRIPRVNIANRNIAQRPLSALSGMQFRGVLQFQWTSAGAQQLYLAPFDMAVTALLWGGGQGGNSGGGGTGGSGGGAAMKSFLLRAGQSVTMIVGDGGAGTHAPGGTTTLILPGAGSVQALGGQSITVPGIGVGGDYNRRGGVPTQAGEQGATAGASFIGSGGGGAAGFTDLLGPQSFTNGLAGGPGGNGSNTNGGQGSGGNVPGGGGGGGWNAPGGVGGRGRITLCLMQFL